MSNNAITNAVSTFLEQQTPEFLRAGSPQFIAFLKAYFAWMEQGDNAIVSNIKSLLSYKDIDTTTDQFIQFYLNDFLPYFPNTVALDERKLVKAAREFYITKGSYESIQFLFRVLYNKEANIFTPADNILRASAGKWEQPQALTLEIPSGNTTFDSSLLLGRQGVGSISNTTCVIESATYTVDPGVGIEILEIFISNITGSFSDLENLNVVYGYDANNNPLVFSEKIIASISNIVINPNYLGLQYKGVSANYPGDPVVISGGLEPNDVLATKAVAYVNSVSSGSITGAIINFGGYYYRIGTNTKIQVINGPGDTTGAGANVIVESFDSTNSIFVLINTDSIILKASQQISSANYGFANIANANQNTTLGAAFSFANLQFAPIVSMNVVNGGGGYQETPNLAMEVTYYSDYTDELAAIPDPADAANSVQFIDDLGFVANTQIIDGGTGYSNVTDVIIFHSAVGYNAAFTFATNSTGTITNISVSNTGAGYFYLPAPIYLANSANTQNAASGTGAVLEAFGFGQGANVDLTVNEIGQIIDFRLLTRGFDYVSTPNVSLRIEDLVINDPGHNLFFSTDSVAYQGANINVVSYIANIDSYNVSTSRLRLYNYQGSFNTQQNLVTTTGNVMTNTSASPYLIVYGNGLAKANAIFQNGLLSFPGYYLDTSGFLSSDQYLQGNVYHAYAYQIQVEQSLNDYKKVLMDLVHPAGMEMLGIYIVQQEDQRGGTANVQVSVIPVVSGSVNANAFDATFGLVGTGTQFTANANPGDYVVFNISDDTRKLQIKEISSITNDTYLIMDSNTTFVFEFPCVINVSSNVISNNFLFGNVGVNDILQTNVAGNSQTSIVQTTSGGSLTVNTVFNINASNVLLLVFPSQNGASYEIMQATE